ncbi:MAG: oligosaccharide flippase family protein [Firmicutes bacterium]|nr:oligosaccharide flippase family protein [Bacillota bacterium]
MRWFRSRLFRATLILFSAGVVNRLLGVAYRVGLARAVGAEGLGLIQRAFPVFLLFLTVATLGLGTGVAKMVADAAALRRYGEAERVRRVALWLVTPSILAATVLLVLAAPLLARTLLHDERIAFPLWALAPALIASGFSSVLRGYFQGYEMMSPIAAGQVAEQLVRVVAVYALFAWYLPDDEAALAALAAGCTALGEWVGLAALLLAYRRRRRGAVVVHDRPPPRRRAVAAHLVRLSWPVALSHVVGSLNATLDAVLIPARLLATGLTVEEATARFGELVGMAVPVVYLATVALHPLSTTLIPEIAEAATLRRRDDLRLRSALALGATVAIGAGMSAAMMLAPAALGRLLYGEPDIAPMLMTLSFAAPFMYLNITGSGILNGLGRTTDGMIIGLAGSILRLLLVYALTGMPQLGIQGAALAIGVSQGAAGLVTWLRVIQLLREI